MPGLSQYVDLTSISIHAPPRGATTSTPRKAIWTRNFNSRPSARGDVYQPGYFLENAEISIHAPPRGATYRQGRRSPSARPISIHAPPRGATNQGLRAFLCLLYFNSRPSARGDPCHPTHGSGRMHISIHAPPRGATWASMSGCSRSGYFNSRPSARGDRKNDAAGRAGTYFNSRPSARGDAAIHQQGKFAGLRISIHAPPRGATRGTDKAGRISENFNSRPSARGDRHRAGQSGEPTHFNSRPSARGDANMYSGDDTVIISIHAPPRGATPRADFTLQQICISIHAPPRGATCTSALPYPPLAVFQFTPLREGRLYSAVTLLSRCYFNSRPSARGDHSSWRPLPPAW